MAQFEAREIGERIQRARLERGMTQEQLAEVSSFSKRSLGDYETGVTIPYRHLRELSRLLGKTPEWFLYGEEAEPAGEQLRELREHLDTRLDDLVGRFEALSEQLRVSAATSETRLPSE